MGSSEKQNAARVLGRLGGLKGGKARAKSLSPERRKEIAQKAVAARWGKAVSATVAGPHDDAAGNILPGYVKASSGGFFAAKTIDQIVAEQGVAPVADIRIFAGAIPDEDVDDFVADIYRSRGVA